MGARLSTGADSIQDYATPANFIAAVERRFGPIVFDLAADASNAKAREYFTEKRNALAESWSPRVLGDGLFWLNPPFKRIAPWAQKCAKEGARGARIALLVPAAIGSNWYRDWCWQQSFTPALNGRLHFDPLRPTWGYNKDCMLCLFGDDSLAGTFGVWKWKGP
jgi:phage N-6-adenine-methyltransferase